VVLSDGASTETSDGASVDASNGTSVNTSNGASPSMDASHETSMDTSEATGSENINGSNTDASSVGTSTTESKTSSGKSSGTRAIADAEVKALVEDILKSKDELSFPGKDVWNLMDFWWTMILNEYVKAFGDQTEQGATTAGATSDTTAGATQTTNPTTTATTPSTEATGQGSQQGVTPDRRHSGHRTFLPESPGIPGPTHWRSQPGCRCLQSQRPAPNCPLAQ
jgi:hypothetical protein